MKCVCTERTSYERLGEGIFDYAEIPENKDNTSEKEVSVSLETACCLFVVSRLGIVCCSAGVCAEEIECGGGSGLFGFSHSSKGN